MLKKNPVQNYVCALVALFLFFFCNLFSEISNFSCFCLTESWKLQATYFVECLIHPQVGLCEASSRLDSDYTGTPWNWGAFLPVHLFRFRLACICSVADNAHWLFNEGWVCGIGCYQVIHLPLAFNEYFVGETLKLWKYVTVIAFSHFIQ